MATLQVLVLSLRVRVLPPERNAYIGVHLSLLGEVTAKGGGSNIVDRAHGAKSLNSSIAAASSVASNAVAIEVNRALTNVSVNRTIW